MLYYEWDRCSRQRTLFTTEDDDMTLNDDQQSLYFLICGFLA